MGLYREIVGSYRVIWRDPGITRRQRVAQQIRGMIRYCRYEEGIVGSTINMVHKQRQSVPTIATNYVL